MKWPLMFASALTIGAVSWMPTSPSLAEASKNIEADLPGTYACEGTQSGGVVYEGTVEVVRDEGTYQLLWTLDEQQYIGIGILRNDVLAVSYYGNPPGLVLYHIESSPSGPRLVGQWTVLGGRGQLYSETLTKVAEGATREREPVLPRTRQSGPASGAARRA
jgi:hypothetical protein